MLESLLGSNAAVFRLITVTCVGLATASIGGWMLLFTLRFLSLALRARRRAAEQRLTERILDELMAGAEIPVGTYTSLPLWQRKILLRVLQRTVVQIKGHYQAKLLALMRSEGFVDIALQSVHARSAKTRHEANMVLSHFDDPASVAALQRSLRDKEMAVRIVAARALLQKDRIESLPELLAHLKFSRNDPPLIMVEVFARLPTRLWGQAIEMLDGPAPAEWKRIMAIALARNHVAAAIPALRRLAQQPSKRLRAAAWVAFLELGDSRVGAYVGEGLLDPSPTVREAACRCAGMFASPVAVERLARLLDDAEWWVRFAAANALYNLGGAGRQLLKARSPKVADGDVGLMVLREREMEVFDER